MRSWLSFKCVFCDRRSSSIVCKGCESASTPTELLEWMQSTGTSCRELAVHTDGRVSARTIRRARDGAPVRAAAAQALSDVTGIPAPTLRLGRAM